MTPSLRGPATWTLTLLVSLMGVGLASPRARAGDDVVTALVAAHAAKDRARFAEIVRNHRPDPWPLVDDLLARDHPDVANACVEAAEIPDRAALEHYVRSYRPADDGDARVALAKAMQEKRSRDHEAALGALRDVETAEGSILEARVGIVRGTVLFRLGRMEDALAAFQGVAEQAAALGWNNMERAALGGVTASAERVGAVQTGMGALRRMAELHDILGAPLRAARALADLGGLHAQTGDLRRSVDLLTAAYAIFVGASAEGDAAQTAVNASLLVARRGELGVAREWLDLAEQHLKKVDDPREQLRFAALRAVIRTETGEYEAGRKDLERVLDAIPETYPVERAEILTQIGHAQHLDGDDDAALLTFEKALTLYEAAKDSVGAGAVLYLAGIAQRSAGRPEKALAALEASLEKAGEDPLNAGYVWLEIGRLHGDAGERVPALEAFARAVPFLEQASAWDVQADVEHERAETLLTMGRASAAYGHALRSIELLDRVVVGLSDEPMARARQRRARFFDAGFHAAVVENRADRAVAVLERWRARALLDAMGGRTRLSGAGLPPALATEEIEATAAVTLAHKRYREARRIGVRRALGAAADAIREAEARLREVVAHVQRTVKRVADLKYPKPLDREGVRKALDEGEALAYYAVDAGRLRAVVVNADGERLVDLGEVAQVSADLALCGRKGAKAKDAQEALGRLRTRLVDDLELPETIAALYVCPQGDLCYVPWPALAPRRRVACVPSGTVLAALRDEPRPRGERILAIGNPEYGERGATGVPMYFRGRWLSPLEETAEEVRAITEPEDVVLTGVKATETALKAELAKRDAWRSVHLACHGLIHPDSPMLSALALSPSEEDDGFLTVLDLLGMDLPTDLLVASACDSGRGEIVSGEGVIGLTRAFLIAGAKRVVVSLWKVDDRATCALMTKFYERWRAGDVPARALQRAQAYVREHEDGKWRHPRYWAAWVLWGLAD